MKKINELPGGVFEGRKLNLTPPDFSVTNARCVLSGTVRSGATAQLPLTDADFSKNIAFLGSIGSGKTNAMLQIVQQIKQSLTPSDVMIIFDTKGDFYREFCEPHDVVISNHTERFVADGADYWNIFAEFSDSSPERLEENISEVARTLFYEKAHNSNQPFFPAAAKDLFAAVLTHFCCSPELEQSNSALRQFLDGATAERLLAMLKEYSDFAAMTSYISGDGGQSNGVLAELQQMSREVFIGDFKKSGNLSMRKLVKGKGARTIFIEYDLGTGNTLTPIYRLLFDMAIKEALARDKSTGNVWFIADEFRLIPHLQHAENAVNFGRSLGVKFLIGIQNIDQLTEAYGENMSNSILSGFSTHVVFRLNDHNSREYVKHLFGENRKAEIYQSPIKNIVENIRVGNVVEDWDIASLDIGEAIIGLPGREPFLFRFDEYQP